MQARIEDSVDILAAHVAVTGATLPNEFAIRIMEDEHPIKVWRLMCFGMLLFHKTKERFCHVVVVSVSIVHKEQRGQPPQTMSRF